MGLFLKDNTVILLNSSVELVRAPLKRKCLSGVFMKIILFKIVMPIYYRFVNKDSRFHDQLEVLMADVEISV